MMNLTEYRRTSTRLADFLPWAALAGEATAAVLLLLTSTPTFAEILDSRFAEREKHGRSLLRICYGDFRREQPAGSNTYK
jgi:hypothetical protein